MSFDKHFNYCTYGRHRAYAKVYNQTLITKAVPHRNNLTVFSISYLSNNLIRGKERFLSEILPALNIRAMIHLFQTKLQ